MDKVILMSSAELLAFYAKNSLVNEDLYENFKHLSPRMQEDYFVLLRDNTKMIGILGIQEDPQLHNRIWVKFFSIHKEFKKQGLSKILIEELGKYCKENNKELKGTSYSNEGYKALYHQILKVAEKYDIVCIQPDLKYVASSNQKVKI